MSLDTKSYFEYAQLSQASYAVLNEGMTDLEIRAALATEQKDSYSTTQGTALAQQYNIAHSQQNTDDGFSATLFQDSTGRYTLAIRGTEPDFNDVALTDFGDIGGDGIALKQAVDLFNYYQRLITPSTGDNSDAMQLEFYEGNIAPEAGVPSQILNEGSSGAPIYRYLKVVDTVTGLGLIPPTAEINVTGHSLGGHLALILSRLDPDHINEVYTYNAPGFDTGIIGSDDTEWFFDTIDTLQLQELGTSTVSENEFPEDKLHNLAIPLDQISDIGEVPNGQIEQFGEAQNVFSAHSIVGMNDALVVYNLLSDLSPSQNFEEFTPLLELGSNQANGDLEGILTALGDQLGFGVGITVDVDNRDQFYKRVKAISDGIYIDASSISPQLKPEYQGLQIVNTSSLSDSANLNNADGFAYRYALLNINPFAITGTVNFYTQHNLNGELNIDNFSDQYLEDRAKFLELKNQYFALNVNNLAAQEEDLYFEQRTDLGTQSVVLTSDSLGGYPHPAFIFGGSGDDTIEGDIDTSISPVSDHLYGGGGNDLLKGYSGDDYLEGGKGIDALDGGDGQDTLIGGEGDDSLYAGKSEIGRDDLLDGGAGNDSYYINTGDGNTVIRDSDLIGQIYFDTQTLGTNITATVPDGSAYKDDDGHRYAYTAGTLNVTLNTGQKITIEGFVKGQGNQLGLVFDDAVAPLETPVTSLDFSGDYAAQDFDPNEAGVQVEYDEFGNVIQDLSAPQDTEDTLYGSADNDLLSAGNENDYVSAKAGDDIVDGGTGVDKLYGGDGNDTLTGGDGSDLLFGQQGDDTLYADDTQSFETALNAQVSDYTRGAILAGGQDNDYLFGNANNDVLLGGAGSDVLIGSAGDDNIRGDTDTSGPIATDWVTTRTIQYGTNTVTYSLENSYSTHVDVNGDDDYLYGGEGKDWLWGEVGNDLLDGGSDNDVLLGGDGKDILLGADGDDYLYGDSLNDLNPDDDVLHGGNGNDHLDGVYGDDTLYGDAGQDKLQGGEGNDHLDGGADDDRLHGEAGVDTLVGGLGNDELYGGTEDDTLSGNEGVDYLDGQEGNDTLSGGDGDDTLFGSAGQDVLNGDDGADHLEGDEGNDTLNGGLGDDVLFGGLDNDILDGGAGNDYLDGGDGDDTLKNSSGDDALRGGLGSDIFEFGLGDGQDTIYDADGTDTIRFTGGLTLAAITSTLVQDTNGTQYLAINFEQSDSLFIKDGHNHTISSYEFSDGTSLNSSDFIAATLTNPDPEMLNEVIDETTQGTQINTEENLIGSGDSDSLYTPENSSTSGTGNKAVFETEEFGTITITEDGDSALRRSSFDAVSINTVSELVYDITSQNDLGLLADTTNSSLNNYGSSSMSFTTYADGSKVTEITYTGYADPSPDTTINTYHYADDSDNVISGTNYQDEIYGYAGIDTITGQDGNDYLDGGADDDTIWGGEGDDTILGGAGNDNLSGEAGSDDISGGDGEDYLKGGQGNDHIYGGADNDLLSGEGGNDTLYGGEGDDNVLDLHGGDDYLYGEAGNDVLDGGDGNDYMYGGTGNDQFTDAYGNNFFYGGDGNDTFSGGLYGNNYFHGGAGDDEFRYRRFFLDYPDPYGWDIFDSYDATGGVDTVSITYDLATYDKEQFNVIRNGNDLELNYGSEKWFSVSNWFLGGEYQTIDHFQFNDGTIWSADFITTLALNEAPTVNIALADQVIDDDVMYYFTLPTNSISDPNTNDVLSYSASLADGSTLPSWLNFDPVTQTFSGSSESIGVLDIKVTATDQYGLFTDLQYSLTVSDITPVISGGRKTDVLTGTSYGELIDGQAGNDQLYGNDGNDTLLGGKGNDTLIGGNGNDSLDGGGGSDTYSFTTGMDSDVINNYDTGKKSNDIAMFDNVAYDDLWFSRVNDDLQVNIAGTDDQVVINDWYVDTDYQLDSFEAGNVSLLNNQVEQLVSAMASYDVPSGAGNVIPQDTKDQLQPVLAASWQ